MTASPPSVLGRLHSWLGQRRRAFDEFAAGEVAPAIGHQLGHKMLRIGCEKASAADEDGQYCFALAL